MPYHVPLNDTWRAQDLADALNRFGMNGQRNGDEVLAVVPIVEFLDAEKILAAGSITELTPRKLGETAATFSFDHDKVIDNILVRFERDTLFMRDRWPDYSSIRDVLKDCGYVCGSDLEIVQIYLPQDDVAMQMIAEIDRLQLEKEDQVANQDFDAARLVLQKQRALRKSVEDRIRAST